MRLNESKEVKKTLQKHLGINLTVVNSAKLFLGRLKGVREPEKKRKIIGDLEAIRIEKEAENTPNAGRFLNSLRARHGIGVRVLGDITPERVEITRKTDHVFISMIKKAGIYEEASFLASISQTYAGLDTDQAVGLMVDTRVYGHIVILRAATTSDFMSAEPYEFSFELLKAMAHRIVNEVDGVSRVTYDLSSKLPDTIELEQRFWIE
ncbi:hypothetical protein BKA56DRAFT_673031 [Ilyonectria sp. MPI-CAGE-AT-0026]|nr:hypothetical protein BKA56DRAFT_673031 [Ilyonectria sp. MPI-CAGE-AT-0026]